MRQVEIIDESLTRHLATHTMIERLKALFPEIDALSLEAALMLERAHAALAEMRTVHRRQFGLPGKRFALLRLLYLSDHRLTIGEIAGELGVGANNISQLIDSAVRDGLVRRIVAEEDRRMVYAVLTEKGEELFAAAFPTNAHRVAKAWSPLTDHQKHLLIDFMSRLYMHYLESDTPNGQGNRVR